MDQESLSRSTSSSFSSQDRISALSFSRDDAASKSEEPGSWSPDDVMTSPVFEFRLGSTSSDSLSPKHCPPTQVMERPDVESDHNRIPSSVFASKPSTPMDWSLASNESLFSIHIKNNSCAQEAADMLSEEVMTSGELMKSDDLTRYTPVDKEGDANNFEKETPSGSDVPKYGLDDPQKVVRWQTHVERHEEEKIPSEGDGLESSPLTNDSAGKFSNQTSAPPKKKPSRSSCGCFSCAWPKCGPKCWPECCCSSFKLSCCCCKCPSCRCSCENGCWAFICCLNCKSKKISSNSMNISAPGRGIVREKLDSYKEKPPSKKWCYIFPRFTCSGSWSWSCRCC